ncbi:MAG: hypothetical protein RL732_462 [Bacteroidota bacterium]
MLTVKHFQFNPLEENTYLLFNDTRDCAIIDPGCYFPEEQQALVEFIDRHQLRPRLLLNTHCHLDHVFGNEFVRQRYQLTLYRHPLEQPLLEFAPQMGRQWGMPVEPFRGEVADLQEGVALQLGAEQIEVLFTPGHSPGSCSFLARQEGWVISGDVLFQESIGRTDLPGGNLQTLLGSIRSQLFPLPDETVVYSGHGPSTTIGHERSFNPFLNV